MKTRKLIPMIQFILEIDFMATKEFCDTFNVPHPIFTGAVESSAKQFLQVDAIKQKMFVDYAKFLNTNMTTDILVNIFNFDTLETRGGFPMYQVGKYTVINDSYGFVLAPYDSVDGFRISKVSDLASLDLFYSER